MIYNFDNYIERRKTNSFKWDGTELMFGTSDLLPMWIADMDLPAPDPVVKALKRRAEHPIYGYTWRSREYFESISNWCKKRHSWQIAPEWLSFSPGIVPAISIAILTYTEPDDAVLVQTPVYAPFFTCIENNSRKMVVNELSYKNQRYEMNFEDLEQKLCTNNVKMAVLCSPHNPVGRVWSKKDLILFGQLCNKYNVLVVSDEIHSDVVFPGNKHYPYSSFKEFEQKSITCIAPSKTFNIAGLCTSVIIIPNNELREQFDSSLMSLGLFAGNVFGIEALIAAYKEGEEWLEQLINYLVENKLAALDYIKKELPMLKAVDTEGTYLLWLDCSELGMTDQQLQDFMINTAKIGLDEGTKFGPGGEKFMRLNIGCPRSLLLEGLKRIKTGLDLRSHT